LLSAFDEENGWSVLILTVLVAFYLRRKTTIPAGRFTAYDA